MTGTDTDTRTAQADARTARLAASVDADTLRTVVNGVSRGVATGLRGTVVDTAEAEAEALADALAAIVDGRMTADHATRAAVRTACRDAIRRYAADALDTLALDNADDNGLALVDALDSAGSARLSHYDSQAGIYRGVSRVPHPTDCLRPAEMPAPEEAAAIAWQSLSDPYRRALAACLAVNRAADSQALALVDALTAYVEQCDRDLADALASARGRRCTLIRRERAASVKARKDARAATRSDHNRYRPRAAEVTEALGMTPTGRNRAGTARALTVANGRYWQTREAVTRDALDRHADALTADADRLRHAADLRGDHAPDYGDTPLSLAVTRARGIVASVRRAALFAACHDALDTADTREQSARGGPYVSTNGQVTPTGRRPRGRSSDQRVSAWGRYSPDSPLATLAWSRSTTGVSGIDHDALDHAADPATRGTVHADPLPSSDAASACTDADHAHAADTRKRARCACEVRGEAYCHAHGVALATRRPFTPAYAQALARSTRHAD